MNKGQAIQEFWNSFGLPAYDENSVPDKTNFPYITYQYGEGSFNNPVAMTASIWTRSTSWDSAVEKLNQVEEVLKDGGTTLLIDDGMIWIVEGTPFAQRMRDNTDEMIKRIYINIMAEYIV